VLKIMNSFSSCFRLQPRRHFFETHGMSLPLRLRRWIKDSHNTTVNT